ncbi:MAG: DNA polymerase I [Leptospiraceae bacterium]|nr:DNA polymerase I [Leptospiraceae bacterium]
MARALLVDGHAMAFRAHYALINQNLTTADGQPTETVYGFFRMLARLLQDLWPEYLAIFFDPPRPTFRHELYPAYKAHRRETPEELKLQLDEIQELCPKLGLPIFIPEKEEADDLIASFAEKFRDKGLRISIASSDKDLFAILRPGVELLRAKKGVSEFTVIDEDTLRKDWGLSPQEIPHFMALTGDSSDNVPGVKGIGEKTAAKLISVYHTLDNLYAHLDKIAPPSLREKLEKGREDAYLSLKLVSLNTMLELPFELEELAWKKKERDLKILLKKGMRTLYYEFEKIFGGIPGQENPLKDEKSEDMSQGAIRAHYKLLKTIEEMKDFIEVLKKQKRISVDTETNSPHPLQAELVGLSFCYKDDSGYFAAYIPCNLDSKNPASQYYNNLPLAHEVLSLLKPVLEDKSIYKIGQNAKYDIEVLSRYDIELASVEDDSMIMAYVLDPSKRRYNMDDLALEFLGRKTITYEELVGTGRNRRALVSLPLEKVAFYSCEDAEVTYRLCEVLEKELQRVGLYTIYREIDMPLMEVLVDMEKIGVKIDAKSLRDFEKELLYRLTDLEKKIYELAGQEFLINSTHQLREILFDKLKIRSVKKTEKGALSTDAEVLEELRHEHPIVELILEHRTISKLLNTYVQVLPEFIDKKTGRIHTSFSQITAATGRLASHDPNLQNIPIKGEEGRALRRAFVAEKGYELLSLDYSQIELRILAHYSEDENLLRAYQEDEDIHDQATYLLFHHRFDPTTNRFLEKGGGAQPTLKYDPVILAQMKQCREFSDLRSQAKVLNFSIAYGVTDYGLSRSLGISRTEASELIRLYFTAFPGIKRYMEEAIEKARHHGYAENLFGRRRYIPDIKSQNRYARQGAERLAINTPIQSTAADIIKKAMIKIHREIKERKWKSRMLLQIHDELLFEVPKEEKDEFYNFARETMEKIVELKVPLKVTGGFGSNWDEAK